MYDFLIKMDEHIYHTYIPPHQYMMNQRLRLAFGNNMTLDEFLISTFTTLPPPDEEPNFND